MLKKVIPWVVIGIFAAVFVVAFVLKDTLNSTISEMLKQQATPGSASSGKVLADSLYNYTKNGGAYEYTFLEFGSTGCTVCKQMEPVLEEIRKLENPKVNVVFLNIMHPENLPMMKTFGISAVPMQILLDKQGKEYFRHYGFISATDLIFLMKTDQKPNHHN